MQPIAKDHTHSMVFVLITLMNCAKKWGTDQDAIWE